MTDYRRHLVVKHEVISEVLRVGHGLDRASLRNLERELVDIGVLLKAADLKAGEKALPRMTGRAMEFFARGRKALRRRGPSWPRFAGHAI